METSNPINLTELFGSQCEPPLKWCDSRQGTRYFSQTTNLFDRITIPVLRFFWKPRNKKHNRINTRVCPYPKGRV